MGKRSTVLIVMNVFARMMTAVFSVLFRLIGLLSPETVYRASRITARLWFRLDKKHRNIVRRNLSRALGHELSGKDMQALTLNVYENICRILFEIGWSYYLRLDDLPRCFKFQDVHHIRTALAKGKGVLVLTAHLGNWELMVAVSPTLGIPTHVVYRPFDLNPLNVFFARIRSRFGAHLIPTAHGMRKILRSLRHGDAVAMLMDQNVDWYEGVFVDFFGHRACTNKGLALLALKTGAPVVPVFLVRDQNRFVVEFCEEIPLIQTGDRTYDIEANTLRYNQAIEAAIRRYPAQWFWVHQRWKTRPYCPLPGNNSGR